MHIWTSEKWKKYYDLKSHRIGLRIRFDKEVDPEVKRACKEFVRWLREEYFFPMRIPIYIKSQKKIKAMDGEEVSATFFRPDDKNVEPYIRVAAGGYRDLLMKRHKDDVLTSILSSIAHELTHYFQWINNLPLTRIGEERQATSYSGFIMGEYSETKEHP